MRNKKGIIQKFNQFVGSLRLPKHFNKKGPKKYTVKQHVVAWLVKQATKSSYRLNSELCYDLQITDAHFTTLGKAIKRFPKWLWDKISSFDSDEELVALDATGIERSNRSLYYQWRIDSKYKVKKCIKLSIAAGVKTKHVLRARVRARPRHDVIDAKKLMTDKRIYLGDKGYNSEKLFEHAYDLGGKLITPPKKGWRRGFYRRKMGRFYDEKIYRMRSPIESIFGSLKRRFGSSVMSRTFKMQRAEILSRIAIYNLNSFIAVYFLLNPQNLCYPIIIFLRQNNSFHLITPFSQECLPRRF